MSSVTNLLKHLTLLFERYAAGIGAGNQLDRSCSRYDGSFANLVALQLDTNAAVLDFSYTACSGAVINGVNDQINALSSDQQFIIISAVCFQLSTCHGAIC